MIVWFLGWWFWGWVFWFVVCVWWCFSFCGVGVIRDLSFCFVLGFAFLVYDGLRSRRFAGGCVWW